MIKNKLDLVPHLPGSYQMLNQDKKIIYIGKAKDLRNRLASYFNGKNTGKTAKLVEEIKDFEYIVTTNELEAFILELNLIKKYNPKYNILLKDDKSYPYIEYIAKPYPKLKIVRYLNVKKKKDKILFGPYPNAYAARKIVNLLNRLYPLKKCEGNPKEVCLYYHIKECLGYCSKEVSKNYIEALENKIIGFLKGDNKIIKDTLMDKIQLHSANLNYEVALELKNELEYMNIVLAKQKTQLRDLKNRDVINYYFNNGYVSIEIFFIRNGKLMGAHNDLFPVLSTERDDCELYIVKYYQNHEIPKEVLINKNLNSQLLSDLLDTKFLTPVRGEKKKLFELAYKNAKLNFKNNFELIKKDEMRTEEANVQLKNILNLSTLNRIEIFDNSNLFGNFSVSGMVVYINGLPAKKEYRKYKIVSSKTDDYHIMQEVIYRRYYRLLVDKKDLPDLIIVDGGLSQISAAHEILNELNISIKVCGIVKNDKHKTNELIDGDTKLVIPIDKTSNLFHFLTRMQDEVHRYTINFHRDIRSKGSISSILDTVAGIGPNRRKMLLKEFGNLTNIKKAPIEELKKVLPDSVATNLHQFLNNTNK